MVHFYRLIMWMIKGIRFPVTLNNVYDVVYYERDRLNK